MKAKKNYNHESERITLMSKTTDVGSPEESTEIVTRKVKKIECKGMILVMIRVCDLMIDDVVIYEGHTLRVKNIGTFVDLYDWHSRVYQLSARSQQWIELIN